MVNLLVAEYLGVGTWEPLSYSILEKDHIHHPSLLPYEPIEAHCKLIRTATLNLEVLVVLDRTEGY